MFCGSSKSFAVAYCVTIFSAINLSHNTTLPKTLKNMKMDGWNQVSWFFLWLLNMYLKKFMCVCVGLPFSRENQGQRVLNPSHTLPLPHKFLLILSLQQILLSLPTTPLLILEPSWGERVLKWKRDLQERNSKGWRVQISYLPIISSKFLPPDPH